MVRRAFWLLVGLVLGMGATVWVLRTLRIRVLDSTPAGVALEVGGSVRRLGADLRDAVGEGRLAAQEREAELRQRLEGSPPGPPQLLAADPTPELLPVRRRTRTRVRH